MKTYIVQTPLSFDLAPYDVGDEVEMDERTARSLLEDGSIASTEAEAPAPLTPAEGITAMLAEDPEKKNPEWWTTDGKPDLKALAARCGALVKAKDRDAAWLEAQGAGV